ncbi:putative peptidase protein [Pseudoxanthomonas suwonensis 11-1]|uniref:Putative peptidase protein n=1 Tax=Pseudoxanthomonas suwonensis (strain 11-1) TaxID=743721 RepID=E6WWP0_PSEUU|nr:putative peptidase protein [Pseudoxanthomonas suwonensis 11-1]
MHNLIGRKPRKDRGERLTGLSSRLGFDRLAHIIPTFARNPGPPVQHPASDVPPALAAFLRGSERRAWVFLWLQGGDPEAADQALAAATRAFQAEAAQLPMADWPGRYWRLLAACPLDSGRGEWPGEIDLLATPAPADRRALLLRLAGGLDEQPAADAMGVSLDTYRERLAAACPRDARGEVDAAAWHRLANAIQVAARELPESRLERIAALRETALAGHGSPEVPPTTEPAPSPRARASAPARPRRPGLVALLLILLVAAATGGLWWWLKPSAGSALLPALDEEETVETDDMRVRDRGPILVEPLPEAEPPAVAGEPVPPALDEPPADPVVADLALLSWYAAGAPESRIEREAEGEGVPPAAVVDDLSGSLAVQAWRGLDAAEQAQLRETAVQFAALPADGQAALRERFAGLDGMERRGWLLGPRLGSDWPRLQPWLGHVPGEERTRLLAVLRAMDSEHRIHLADVLRRQSPAGRIELRQELLAIPAERRKAWLEEAARR